MRPERSAGPGPAQARYRWLFSVGHTQELPGSWKIHPVPLPRSRIPASSSDLTVSAQQCRPHFADSEGTDFTDLSRLNHAASVPAAYASSGALPHPHARLASGRWLALAGRDSNPLDSIEKFPSATSDFLLSQVYPGATADFPRRPAAPFAGLLGDQPAWLAACSAAFRIGDRKATRTFNTPPVRAKALCTFALRFAEFHSRNHNPLVARCWRAATI